MHVCIRKVFSQALIADIAIDDRGTRSSLRVPGLTCRDGNRRDRLPWGGISGRAREGIGGGGPSGLVLWVWEIGCCDGLGWLVIGGGGVCLHTCMGWEQCHRCYGNVRLN